ncbi:MAG: hypothetical protein KAG14_05110, partial [Mycoplasmataceae bacterium]|nr:hypothetical protein [Mycoplasmataceae bacterium]
VRNLIIKEFSINDNTKPVGLFVKIFPGSTITNIKILISKIIIIKNNTGIISEYFYGGQVSNILINNLLAGSVFKVRMINTKGSFGILFGNCNIGDNEAIIENINLYAINVLVKDKNSYTGFICGSEIDQSQNTNHQRVGIINKIQNLTICKSKIDTINKCDTRADIISGIISKKILDGRVDVVSDIGAIRNPLINGFFTCDVTIKDGGFPCIRYKSPNSCSDYGIESSDHCNIFRHAPNIKIPKNSPTYIQHPVSSKDFINKLDTSQNSPCSIPKQESSNVIIKAFGISAASMACIMWVVHSYKRYYKENHRGLSLLAAPITNIHRVLCRKKTNTQNQFIDVNSESIEMLRPRHKLQN